MKYLFYIILLTLLSNIKCKYIGFHLLFYLFVLFFFLLEIFVEQRLLTTIKAFRRSRLQMFFKIGTLKHTTLLKKRLWYQSFLVNFVKFSWTPILQNSSGRLLLCGSFVQLCNLNFIYLTILYYLFIYLWICFSG